MKNRFLNFLRKYWLCILLSVIMVIGMSLTTIYADLYKTGSEDDMIRFNLKDLYLVYGLPLYSSIYGCLTYIKTKNRWFPLLILGVVNFLYWFRFDIKELAWLGTYIWSAVPVFFSLIGSAITAFILHIIKSMKEVYK